MYDGVRPIQNMGWFQMWVKKNCGPMNLKRTYLVLVYFKP